MRDFYGSITSCFITLGLFVSTVFAEDVVKPTIEEQIDPFMQQRMQQYPFGNGLGGGSFGVTNFEFQCKCAAKHPNANNNAPTDANQAAQQQIQQLNEQVRRLQEQLRRQQQGASAFEQFAQMLSMADGLDCNCSGTSSPMMGTHGAFPTSAGSNLIGTPFNPMLNQPHFGDNMGMLPFQQRNVAMMPRGPMFPVKSL